MHKPLHSLSGRFTFICFLLLAKLSLAQTFPTPQTLPYSQNFGTAAFSAMPAGTNSFTRNNATTITTQAAAETATPLANAIVAPLTGNIPNNLGAGTHGYSQNGTNAQVVIQTSASGNNDAANSVIIALNTAGWINIVLSYQLTILAGTTASGVVTQYRIGATGSWVTLTGPGNPTLGNASSTPTNLSFALPAACNNQPTVYIRWSPWNGVGNNNINARFRFALDNITATGTVLPPQPGGIFGANLWLKGNTGTSPASGTLSNWVDQTGTNTFTVSGTPQTGVTANQINFNNAVGFNGTNAYLTGNTNITFQTLYAVIKRDNTNFTSTVISATSPTSENVGYMMKGDKMATGNNLIGTNLALYFQSAGNLGIEKPRLGTLEIVNDQGSTSSKTFIDGQSFAAQYFSGTGTQMKTFSAIPYIGRSQKDANPDYFAGSIAELVMYPASHTATERLRIQSYLAIKYGITLDPSVGNYLNASGVSIWNSAAYWNDVFGVGRDDASTLLQTQSNSVNTGSGDGTGQAGKGNLVIQNATFSSTNRFMMVGHDVNGLTTQFVTVPAAQYGKQRLARNWKMKNTNPVTSIDLVFDLNGIAVAGTKAADFKLLIDVTPDEDYSDAFIANASSFSNNKVTFSGLNFGFWPEVNFTLITGNLVNPGGISGSNLWVKGNQGTSPASGTLTGWVDQSNINTFTVSGNPQTGVSANQINFNNAVAFDGSGDWLTGNTAIKFQTLYAIIKRDNNNNTTITSATLPNNENIGYMMKGDKMATGNNLPQPNQLYFQSAGSLGAAKPRLGIVEIVNDQGTTSSKSFIDGTAYATQFLAGSGSQMKTFTAIPYIGRSQQTNETDEFAGKIGELVMYPAAHTATERLKVESYLAIKYGITLDPSLVNYLNAAGTSIWSNTVYWNDVFGIGRDDSSGLNQTQSNSVNTGSGTGIGQSGKGNITMSATGNLTNGQYLVIGNNAGALTDNISNLFPNFAVLGYTRLVRQWKVANTASTGTVNLVFDTSGLVLSGKLSSNIGDYFLSIDVDGDGSFITGTHQPVAASAFTANGISFQNVTLPNNATFTIALKLLNQTNVWTGAVDSAWNNANNWSLMRNPISSDSIVIDGSGYNKPPVLNVQFLVGYRMQFVNNPQFTIAPGGMLSVAAGAIADVTSTPRSKTILSNSSGSGLIGKIEGTLIGNTGDAWLIERWFGARRSFRYVCSPVTASNTSPNYVRDLWMGGDDLGTAWNYPYPLGDPHYTTKGAFLHITGGTKASGFDQNQTGNPSAWFWQPTTQAWVPFTTTNFRLLANTGVRLVVRGDRGTNLDENRPPASETKIYNVGPLQTGNITVAPATMATNPNDYSMVANPYQSIVDASLIGKIGVTDFYYMWDANVVGTAGFGAYVTVDILTNSSSLKPGAVGVSQANKFIQPGQAVFFQNNSNLTHSITFTEASKGTPANQTQIFDADPTDTDQVLWITLSAISDELKTTNAIDGSVIRFNSNYTTAADYEDGNKLNNPDETIGIDNNGKYISIDKRNMPLDGEIAQLKTLRYRTSFYSMQLDATKMVLPGMDAYLKDRYLQTETLIVPGQVNDYSFKVVSADTASTASSRFSIVFRTSTILPITFVKLETEQQGQQFNLLWTSSSNKVGNIFEVQRSATGNQFDKMASLPVNSNASNKYNWLDATPEKGNNFYRIKLTEPDGNIVYSNIARVNLRAKGRGFDVYPNPVKGQSFTVYLNDLPAGQYQVSLVNSSGQRLIQTVLQHNGGNASRQLNIGRELPYGSYQVILQQDDQQYTRKIIIE